VCRGMRAFAIGEIDQSSEDEDAEKWDGIKGAGIEARAWRGLLACKHVSRCKFAQNHYQACQSEPDEAVASMNVNSAEGYEGDLCNQKQNPAGETDTMDWIRRLGKGARKTPAKKYVGQTPRVQWPELGAPWLRRSNCRRRGLGERFLCSCLEGS